MKRPSLFKSFKWIHRWLSLLLALFIICWAFSGIVLNHRKTFAGWEINRKFLPKEFQYKNWNNAALKGAATIGEDSTLLYGNIGIWLTDNRFSTFYDFNSGFPKGIDHRKTFKIVKTEKGSLFAATLFGLYRYDYAAQAWQKQLLPIREEKITGLAQVRDSLFVMSRSHILASADIPGLRSFNELKVPAPQSFTNKISLFKTLWVIHSGEVYGNIGKLLADLFALLFLFFTLSGFIYYFFPGIIRRRKKKKKQYSQLISVNKFSTKWHNKLGIYLFIMLLITATTGIFLRPPLLIAIANTKVDKLKYTSLDNSNPWSDCFRDILYDEGLNRFLIGTTEGVYFSEDYFQSPLKLVSKQVPISVMGINAFEKRGRGDYLIGSFYGLYRWMPDYLFVRDYITKSPDTFVNPMGAPVGKYMSAGYIRDADGNEYHVDYNYGIFPLGHNKIFPAMPENILQASPMSLWNVALEIHTARFFRFLFGRYYILVVPLFGLGVLAILLSGVFIWVKKYLQKRANRK